MSARDERARSTTAATRDFTNASQAARNISNDWHRCQALAAVARYAPEADVVRVAREAFSAAMKDSDPYMRVAVCAWPLSALAERRMVHPAKPFITLLVDEAPRIEHPVRRLDALFLIWQGSWPLPSFIRKPLIDLLLASCPLANSWKAGYIQRDTALMTAHEDIKFAQRIITAMPDGIYKRQAQRRLDAGAWQTPRAFFYG